MVVSQSLRSIKWAAGGRSCSLAAAIIVFLATLTNASAAVMTTPTGLNPGDKYRLAFVTNTIFGGDHTPSTDINKYNQDVSLEAGSVPALAVLGTTWWVIGSTSTVDARDNTQTNPLNASHSSVPIFLLDGTTQIADSNADLWDGTLDAPLNIFANGTQYAGSESGSKVWTGTNSDGTRAAGNTLGTLGPYFGRMVHSTSEWIYDDTSQHYGHVKWPLYAISDELTVVPVPGGLILFGSALAILTLAQRRFRHTSPG